MLEWTGWWPDSLKTWGKVVSSFSEDNHRVQRLGGVPGMCHMSPSNPHADQVHRWESAINYASQGHYYNVSNEAAVVNNTRFMLRYGGVLYNGTRSSCRTAISSSTSLQQGNVSGSLSSMSAQ